MEDFCAFSFVKNFSSACVGIFLRKEEKYPPVGFPKRGVIAGLYEGNWRLLGNILPSQSSPTTPSNYARGNSSRWRDGRGEVPDEKEGKQRGQLWHGDLGEFKAGQLVS